MQYVHCAKGVTTNWKISVMKILTSMINLLFAFSLLLSACSTSGMKDGNGSFVSDTSKILIVYLTRTNNTKAIAEIIQKNVGGKLVALELEKPIRKIIKLSYNR
jgi:hypothetical protein